MNKQTDKQLITLVALDTAFTLLLDNLRKTDPITAQALAIDLKTTAAELPQYLPAQAHAASDVLMKWHDVLCNDPNLPGGH